MFHSAPNLEIQHELSHSYMSVGSPKLSYFKYSSRGLCECKGGHFLWKTLASFRAAGAHCFFRFLKKFISKVGSFVINLQIVSTKSHEKPFYEAK